MDSTTNEPLLSCIRCGLCLSVCPSYRETLIETDSPRGRVALIRAVDEQRLAHGANYADKLFRCLLCASCENICPSGVIVAELLQQARDDVAAHQLLPERLAELDAAIVAKHNISGEDNAHRLLWTDNLPEPPSGLDKAEAEIAFFVGCVGSFFPRSYTVPRSFVEILEKAEVDYALLGDLEWCCGYPQFINGELHLAEQAIRHNVEQVTRLKAKRVVFTCPSCYHIWKHIYPQVLGHELDVELLHATELLDRLLEEKKIDVGPFPQTVTYHDPCDLGRKSGVFEAPRSVLNSIPGLTFVEMAETGENALCCGGGGNLESHNADLSQRIAMLRVQQAVDTGAQVIVSACQQCERTLANAARAGKTRIRVMDINEVVLKAMDSASRSKKNGAS